MNMFLKGETRLKHGQSLLLAAQMQFSTHVSYPLYGFQSRSWSVAALQCEASRLPTQSMSFLIVSVISAVLAVATPPHHAQTVSRLSVSLASRIHVTRRGVLCRFRDPARLLWLSVACGRPVPLTSGDLRGCPGSEPPRPRSGMWRTVSVLVIRWWSPIVIEWC